MRRSTGRSTTLLLRQLVDSPYASLAASLLTGLRCMSTANGTTSFEGLFSNFVNYEREGMPSKSQVPTELKLDRMLDVAQALGDPQKAFKAVHVTGSKGKGSTAATIAAIVA